MSDTDFGEVIRKSFSKLQVEVDRLGKEQQELHEIASERLSGGDLSAFVPPQKPAEEMSQETQTAPAEPQDSAKVASLERKLKVLQEDMSSLEQRYTEQVDVVDKLTMEKQKLAADLHQTRMLVRNLTRQNATLAAATLS